MRYNTFRKTLFLVMLITGNLAAQDILDPYSYDPSWKITYSEAKDTLYYYPREDKAKQFKIPASVRVIEERAFQCNEHLTQILIPEGVNRIGLGSFMWSKKLTSVTIKGPVKTIPWRAFEDCPELHSVDIPKTVTVFDGQTFSGCKKLEKIIIRNPEPPELFPWDDDQPAWDFWEVNLSKCVVYVPSGSVEKYKNAEGWMHFKNIKEL